MEDCRRKNIRGFWLLVCDLKRQFQLRSRVVGEALGHYTWPLLSAAQKAEYNDHAAELRRRCGDRVPESILRGPEAHLGDIFQFVRPVVAYALVDVRCQLDVEAWKDI
jgi:hypothetical protein